MKSALLIAALALPAFAAGYAGAQYVHRPDEKRTLGQPVPRVWFTDEFGDTLRLDELAGRPLVVSPVFTSCPHVCPAITASLISALEGVGGVGSSFNVLTLSFDPDDSEEDLQEYRRQTSMPSEWMLAAGPPDQVDRFLTALDFDYAPLAGGGFAHANLVAFLSPDLTVSGYLYGLAYSADEVKAALRVALGPASLVQRARPWLLAAAFLALIAAALTIVLTARRRSTPPKTDTG